MKEGTTPQSGSQVASRLKAIGLRAASNPRWFLMESFSRFVFVRQALGMLRRRPREHRYNVDASQFQRVDITGFTTSLRRDGYCEGITIPGSITERMLRLAFELPCYGDARPQYGFKYRDRVAAQKVTGRAFSQGTYLFADELQLIIDELSKDPLLLAIATEYFGSPAVMTGNRLWWVFATPEKDYDSSITTSFFHYDKDDFAAVRFFFYLTEVDRDHGPHVVVRGSHTRKKLSQMISLGERTDQEIIDYYGADKLTTIYGKPGSGFAEDPFCFHRATRPIAGDRLMLEIKFATRNYNIFPEPDRSAVVNVLETPAALHG